MIATILGYAKGIVLIDYLEKGHVIDGESYANQLKQLRGAINNKCLGKLMTVALFYQNNAQSQKFLISMVIVCNCVFELIDHFLSLLIWPQLTNICSLT